MASPSISDTVGQNSKNNPADVKTVQTLLNGYVISGRLDGLKPLPIDGAWQKTVPYIEKFQKTICGTAYPDGKINPGKTTWQKLVLPPYDPVGIAKTVLLATSSMVKSPPDADLKWDIWLAALGALVKHAANPILAQPNIVTMVDFRISRKKERLWTVDLEDLTVLHKTWCAHGTNSGKGDYATKFDDRDKKTSLGSYITFPKKYGAWVGNVTTEEPALKLHGLDHGVNGRAVNRGILFHAATYVNPPIVGNSWGCFATPVKTNRLLLPIIEGGSFVYAYAGMLA